MIAITQALYQESFESIRLSVYILPAYAQTSKPHEIRTQLKLL